MVTVGMGVKNKDNTLIMIMTSSGIDDDSQRNGEMGLYKHH